MGTLKSIEAHSTLRWMNAMYADESGEYEIVFTTSRDENSGFESRELVNVEKGGVPLYPEAPVWREIEKVLQAVELEGSHSSESFTIEIGKQWLETLDSLTELVLAGSKASPEEALETAIFSQIKEQRGRV